MGYQDWLNVQMRLDITLIVVAFNIVGSLIGHSLNNAKESCKNRYGHLTIQGLFPTSMKERWQSETMRTVCITVEASVGSAQSQPLFLLFIWPLLRIWIPSATPWLAARATSKISIFLFLYVRLDAANTFDTPWKQLRLIVFHFWPLNEYFFQIPSAHEPYAHARVWYNWLNVCTP